ncbi:hypothetical protein MF672_017390 [Actinomadura sp. ATCC 31491]|uniref:DUF2207 domain-containing protein n=1 Tax=Actinomadura luzonensis TaxID=2805427 RepID=A0ABT0FT73_9ACTN|nr:hypothetical protein [Actinomadura luzonensis]MCK2215546.1 hypothetical protein [Actinomadura luzonensis]
MTYGPYPPPPPPVVIDVGGDTKVRLIAGGAVAAALGLVTLVSVAAGQVTGGGGVTVAAAVLGLGFLAIGLLPVLTWRRTARPRRLILDAHGVRWDDPRGRPWAVGWAELSGVGLSRTRQRAVTLADHLVRRTMVRLDLFPADPGFRARHPEMEHLWEFHTVRNGYRLPLGSRPAYVPLIEEGMRRLRPAAYLGVKDEGFTVGLV